MNGTREKSTYLLWIVWIAAALLAIVLGVLIFLEVQHARQETAVPPENTEQTEPVTTTEPTETEVPTTDGGLPILDLQDNPYRAEDFGYRGKYLTLNEGSCLLGVDVSAWQNEINWTLVKAVGMDFAMIRLAWRGTDGGGIYADEYALQNLEGAAEAGMLVGGYFFSQAVSPEEAVEEAEFLLELLDGRPMDLPIVFDWEYTGQTRTQFVDEPTLTACARAFCETIEAAGYEAMIYFNPYMVIYEQIDLEELKEFDFWLAMWDTSMEFAYRVDMWQYTDCGSVAGIEGNVDLNIYFQYEN